jgi:hypothetical protein
MGGDAPDPPQPSAEERALQQEQTEILRQQRDIIQSQVKQQELLAPFMYKQMGLTPKMDASGKIIGFEEIEDGTSDLRKEIEMGFLQRTQKALKGELPVDPALERELSEGEQTLRDHLFRNLGSGYETSSAGIEALGDFQERATTLREGARRGDLTLAEQLGLAREEGNQMRVLRTLQGQQSISDILGSGASRLSQVAAGYNMPLQNLFQQRQMGYQGALQASQAQGQTMAGLGMGVGSLAMAGAMFF